MLLSQSQENTKAIEGLKRGESCSPSMGRDTRRPSSSLGISNRVVPCSRSWTFSVFAGSITGSSCPPPSSHLFPSADPTFTIPPVSPHLSSTSPLLPIISKFSHSKLLHADSTIAQLRARRQEVQVLNDLQSQIRPRLREIPGFWPFALVSGSKLNLS